MALSTKLFFAHSLPSTQEETNLFLSTVLSIQPLYQLLLMLSVLYKAVEAVEAPPHWRIATSGVLGSTSYVYLRQSN